MTDLIIGDPIRLALLPVYTALIAWWVYRKMASWREQRRLRRVVLRRINRLRVS